MSEQLELCPFCGGLPYFSEVRQEDDARYMVMELTCCGTMSEAIGWGKYRNMRDDEIHAYLKERLIATWNTRYSGEELAATKQKLAAWQALVSRKNLAPELCDGFIELNTLLSAARAEGVEEGRKMAVPEGWQVVPKAPTNDMLAAAQESEMDHSDFEEWMDFDGGDCIRRYAAMLAASPTHKEE